MTAALAIHALAKRFHVGVPGCSGTVEVLSGVDLVVDEGELVEVVGSAGSGKSSLLLCAAGLLRPDGGRIAWGGVRSSGELTGAVYVAAEAFRCAPATVREHVSEWARRTRRVGRQCPEAVDDALGRTGLESVALTPLAELNRGARWRLLVARALLARPRLLLLDEPFAGLALGERVALTQCLGQVAGSGIAVLLASTPGDAGATAARAATLCAGRLRSLRSHDVDGVHPSVGDRRRVQVAEGSAGPA